MARAIVLDTPPPVGSFGRVLRRYDRDPAGAPPRFASYSTHIKSKRIVLDGRCAFTLFFPKTSAGNAAAHRATRLGWKDETEAYMASINDENNAPIARNVPMQPGAVEHAVKGMTWNALRTEAKAHGINAKAPRGVIEKAVIAKLTGGE
jgi:hypothetical protein